MNFIIPPNLVDSSLGVCSCFAVSLACSYRYTSVPYSGILRAPAATHEEKHLGVGYPNGRVYVITILHIIFENSSSSVGWLARLPRLNSRVFIPKIELFIEDEKALERREGRTHIFLSVRRIKGNCRA